MGACVTSSHYDWWMFPVQRPSASFGDMYAVSEADVENPQQNPHVQKLITAFGEDRVVPVCVRIESELSARRWPSFFPPR